MIVSVKTNQRLNNISLLRLMAMLSVLVYHFLSRLTPTVGLTYFPGTIGVQFFLFISGFLYSTKVIESYKRFFKKQLYKLLLPATIYIVITISATAIFAAATGTSLHSDLSTVLPDGVRSYSFSHLWFIPAIIACYGLVPILQNIHNDRFAKKPIKYLLLALALLIDVVLSLHRLMQMIFTTFVLGFFFGRWDSQYTHNGEATNTDQSTKSTKRAKIILSIVCVLTLAVGTVSYYYVNPIKVPMILWIPKNYFIKIITSLMGCAICILMWYIFGFINRNNVITKMFDKLDKYTYCFYLAHHFYTIGFASALLFVSPNIPLNCFIVIGISILSAIALYWTCVRVDYIFKKLKQKKTENNAQPSQNDN